MKTSGTLPIHLTTPLTDAAVAELKAGDRVLLSGEIYTARDAAHKRLVETLAAGEILPFDLVGQVIYYVGPAPARPGQVIGPAGPTTSARMDPYTPILLEHGLKGMVGKGRRNAVVRQACVDHRAVYLVAVGGAAALISQQIIASTPVAYEDLGTESIKCLTVEDMPLIVANDIHNGDLYEQGAAAYRNEKVLKELMGEND
ncbi:MAG: Fe-S-containing hydro-lyase [Anaerolineaceae bacterium]|nr:Fe-S-containing hydro-lyase [Anaerolineaceae bacterium]